MQTISSAWLYPLILVAGALQACGPLMNGALRKSLENHWRASTISFLPIVAFLMVLFFCLPSPLPSATANILMSLAVDHFGSFGIEQHSLNIWRSLGGALMTGGIVLIALF